MPRRRAPRNNTGRRSILTHELAEKIVEAVKAGNYLGPAARQHGVAESTLYQWLQQGEDAQAAIQRGEKLAQQARIYASFAESCQRARARAETRAVGVITKVIEGGILIERKPSLNGDGLPIYDSDGTMLYDEKFSLPDGKLALEYLRRSFPQRWAPQDEGARDEVGTATGGASVDGGDASRIAERLQEFVERRGIEQAQMSEEVVDAEIVE